MPHAPHRNREKLIRCRRRADSIPRKSRFRIAACKRRTLLHSINALPIPRNIGLPTSFAGFCPGWASFDGETPVEAWGSHAMSLVRCLYNRCEIACCGFGDLAFDSMRERRVGGREAACCSAHTDIAVSIGTIRKYQIEPMPCRETSITIACYLCNTLWKTGGAGPLQAVPLLRV